MTSGTRSAPLLSVCGTLDQLLQPLCRPGYETLANYLSPPLKQPYLKLKEYTGSSRGEASCTCRDVVSPVEFAGPAQLSPDTLGR